MKLFFKIILIGIFFIGFGESKANTLLESLQFAYFPQGNTKGKSAGGGFFYKL